MTLKAKWDKLQPGNLNAFIWVFVQGRSFVIHDAKRSEKETDKDADDLIKKFNNKNPDFKNFPGRAI